MRGVADNAAKWASSNRMHREGYMYMLTVAVEKPAIKRLCPYEDKCRVFRTEL